MADERRPFFGPVTAELTGWDGPATVACVVTAAALIVGHYQGATHSLYGFFPRPPPTRLSDLYPYFWWYGSSCALFIGLPLVAAAATPGIRIRELGVGAGDWRFGLGAATLLLGVMLPVVFLAALTPTFAGHYPLASSATRSGTHLVAYEVAYVAYFVAWEFLYRGYLLFSLARKIGNLAIPVQAIPFALLHLGKPEVEAFGSIVAALVLGVVALRARSFWYGVLIHAAVAVTMDLRAGLPRLGH